MLIKVCMGKVSRNFTSRDFLKKFSTIASLYILVMLLASCGIGQVNFLHVLLILVTTNDGGNW